MANETSEPYPDQKKMGNTVADHRHVSVEEAIAGSDEPEDFDYDENDPVKTKMPTRKWLVARVTALAGLATMWATTGSWDTEETVMAIAIVSAGLVSWLVPNDDTPGGVPEKHE